MKKYIIGGVVVIILLVLLSWGRFTGTTLTWKDTTIECLNGGHQNLALHFHPELKIFVDGEEESIAPNIGINSACMAEVHTHDPSGTIHVEATEHNKTFTLGNFFEVLGESINRDSFELSMTVDGEVSTDFGALVLYDQADIVLNYVSSGEVTNVSEDENEGEDE